MVTVVGTTTVREERRIQNSVDISFLITACSARECLAGAITMPLAISGPT